LSGWIKFWKDMPNDPRVLAAAAKLADRYILAHRSGFGGSDLPASEAIALCRNAVTGALATLWAYADEHIHDDDSLPLTSQTIDAVVGIEGFFDLLPREWIDELDDGSLILPGYCEKNSLIAKRKRTVKSNARVTRWRSAKKTNSNAVTTQHETQCNAAGDLDQDSDRDKNKKDKNPSASATPTRKVVSRGASEDPEWLLDFKLTYPTRAGDQGWRKAVRAAHARMAEGHTSAEFVAGARRYATFCEASGKVGSEYVKQACTFLGPDKPFLLPWHAPPKQENATERILRALNGTDHSRTIEHEPEREFPALTR
jgi:hypothetical protein